METVVKSQETRDGVCFRAYKDNKYFFANVKFKNYFYVKTEDYDLHKDDFHNKFTFCIEKAEPLGQFTKIILSNNFMRYKTKDFWDTKCQTYEADIKANKRYLLDSNLILNNENMPYAFFDIETDDRLPLKKDERGAVVVNADARILSFSGVNNEGTPVGFLLNSDTDEDERALLTMVINYFSNFGVISGWYSEKFDMPYIKQRCDTLGVNYSILDYINHLDYKELFIKYDKKSRGSYSLNAISNEVLNESKIDQEKGNGKIYEAWQNNAEHLLKYNIEDSNLIYKINAALMFIEVCMKRANNSGCHVRSTMHNSDSGDYLLMREYKKANVIMPSKPTKDQLMERLTEKKISGGFTRCLIPGYHEQVDVWDYKSFYPWTIATFNIDPMTFVERLGMDTKETDYPDYIVTPSNFNEERQSLHPRRLYKKEMGVVPKVCLRLVSTRDEIKYTMKDFKESDPAKYKQMYLEQYALKTDGNSIYGVLSFPPGRYYNWDVGDTVTTCCQTIIKRSYKMLEEWGCTVIGGDTDSTFVVLNGHDKEEINQKFRDYYKELAKEWNVDKPYIEFEHEKTVSPMLFVKKKNYVYKESNGEIIIKGLECIKADSNPLAASLQKEFVMAVMNKEVDHDTWDNKVTELNSHVLDQEMTTEELILSKAISKMPSEYEGYVIDKKTQKPKIKADGSIQNKAIPAHVKLAQRLLDKGVDLYPGSKIQFIVIANKPILAISPQEYKVGSGEFLHKHKKKGEYTYEWSGGYDGPYYCLRVIKPLIKVVATYYTTIPQWDWGVTDAVLNKIHKEEDD